MSSVRVTAQDFVDVERVDGNPVVLDALSRENLESPRERLGVLALVRVDPADEDVEPGVFALMGFGEHRVGLPHPRRHAEEDAQFAERFFPRLGEHRLRIGAQVFLTHDGFSSVLRPFGRVLPSFFISASTSAFKSETFTRRSKPKRIISRRITPWTSSSSRWGESPV